MSLVRLADPTSAPPWAHKFRSADLDEVRAFGGSFGALRSCYRELVGELPSKTLASAQP
jgi:hypothetical protein